MGQRMVVDFAARTGDVICPETGEVHDTPKACFRHDTPKACFRHDTPKACFRHDTPKACFRHDAQIFVAVLGASNYAHVEASWTQTLPNWIAAHVRAFDCFGGVPGMIVSDNLKAGVIKACLLPPRVQPHPWRPGGALRDRRGARPTAQAKGVSHVVATGSRPMANAKVENAVLLAERLRLAKLRNQTFFGLDDLNATIRALRDALNARTIRHLGSSRRALFETIDRPALKPLPMTPYAYSGRPFT